MITKKQIIGIGLTIILLTVYFTGATEEQCHPLILKDERISSEDTCSTSGKQILEGSPPIVLHSGDSSHPFVPENNEKKGGGQAWPKAPSPWKNQAMLPAGISIYTNFEGIQKQTSIIESLIEGIDVDNNPATGPNGKDIKISFFILPFPDLVEGNWVLFLSSFLRVVRLGEEIKYGDFQIYLELSFTLNGFHVIRIGYSSPKNEEIPRELNEVVTVAPYIFYEEQPEFYIDTDPVFDEQDQDLTILTEYLNQGHHRVTIDYTPAVDTTLRITPRENLGKIDFFIQRISSDEQTIRINYEGLTSLGLTLEDIPEIMTFTLGFGENGFEYSASDTFNATLMLTVFEMGLFMRIEYLPQHLKTRFLNEGGYLFISIDDAKTRFILANDEYTPTKSFIITNLAGESIIQWLLTQKEGYVTIAGFQGLQMETFLRGVNYDLHVTSILQTEYFEIRWDLGIPGFVSLDTDLEWLNFYSFNLTFDTGFGVLIEANLLRAEDFQVEWQTSIPLFTFEGTIDFLGSLTFKVRINGVWYFIF